jgi:hypothetical protein
MNEPEFAIMRWGLLNLSVCTRLDDAETELRANRSHPTGISSQWRINDLEPVTCANDSRNRHITLVC